MYIYTLIRKNRLENQGFFLSLLSGKLFQLFILSLCFWKTLVGIWFKPRQQKVTRTKNTKDKNKQRGFTLLRCVCKDGNKELFVNPLWADNTPLGSFFSFRVYEITLTQTKINSRHFKNLKTTNLTKKKNTKFDL